MEQPLSYSGTGTKSPGYVSIHLTKIGRGDHKTGQIEFRCSDRAASPI